MALKKCKVCGKEVSTKAKACPGCGSPIKAGTSPAAAGCLIVFVVMLGIGVLAPMVLDQNYGVDEPKRDAKPAPLPAPKVDPQKLILDNLKIEDTKGYIDGNYMRFEGRIRNLNDFRVEFVKVYVKWLDKEGNVVDSDYTYAVGGEGLTANSARSFEVSSPKDDRMAKFSYWVEL